MLWQDALHRLADLTQGMIEDGAGSTIMGGRILSRVPVYVRYLAPLPGASHDYTQFRSRMSAWLAENYNIEALSVVQGSGVDLSASNPEKRGDRHGQVSILYGIPDADIGRLFSDQENTQLKRA